MSPVYSDALPNTVQANGADDLWHAIGQVQRNRDGPVLDCERGVAPAGLLKDDIADVAGFGGEQGGHGLAMPCVARKPLQEKVYLGCCRFNWRVGLYHNGVMAPAQPNARIRTNNPNMTSAAGAIADIEAVVAPFFDRKPDAGH